MIQILPIQPHMAQWFKYRQLFEQCFSTSPKFEERTLEWLYSLNPDGFVVGFDAWDGDILAAHYACVPATVEVGGEKIKALLSLNTATHPMYQGQGLFTKLAERTYEAAAASGFDCVYGVANANSTPGFTRKLGFQLIQPLEAKIGLGPIGLNHCNARRLAEFRRVWSTEAIQWRCSNPVNPIRYITRNDVTYCRANAVGKLIQAYAECSAAAEGSSHGNVGRQVPSIQLYIGLEPAGTSRFHSYVDIPQRFRPSPLNFIYRSLTSRVSSLNRGHISFSFLDFDAY